MAVGTVGLSAKGVTVSQLIRSTVQEIMHRVERKKGGAPLKAYCSLVVTAAGKPRLSAKGVAGFQLSWPTMQEIRDSMEGRWCTAHDCFNLAVMAAGKLGPSEKGVAGLQLIWPTVQEIRDSVEGWRGGASVPGPAKNVNKPFLQPYWHRSAT